MDLEIRCPACSKYYNNPVILPTCEHSVCTACALKLQAPLIHSEDQHTDILSRRSTIDIHDIDKMSLISDADSGVSMGTGSSRPNSYIAASTINLLARIQEGCQTITCPHTYCKKVSYLSSDGISVLPHNRLLETIVDKFRTDQTNFVAPCSKCTLDKAEATCMCEQCELFFCEMCKEETHPLVGPLAKHKLVSPSDGRVILRQRCREKETKCTDHPDEVISMFCSICKEKVCYLCVQSGEKHLNHDVQAISSIVKAHKNELSLNIHNLSEKVKSGSAFTQKLCTMKDQIEENAVAYKELIDHQIDEAIARLNAKRQELQQYVEHNKELRLNLLKQQVSECKTHLSKTTGLIQFSVEAMREPNQVQFTQVSNGLVERVGNANKSYSKDLEMRPKVSPYFELSLDNRPLLHEIDTMNFFQMRVPGPPVFIPEKCRAENNTVMLVWTPYGDSIVDAYILEIDDGAGGNFREVYCGVETVCNIDGLHFDSLYNARVKCYNQQGESQYSDCICLQTSEVAWFTFDPETAHDDILLSEDGLTAACSNFDDKVVLGSCGFSRGVHYWEFKVDRYDNHPDPAFGVARLDTAKDSMLGKDDLSWSMYLDNQRSWFMHGGEHTERVEGGVAKGNIVGVKLDLNKKTLSYYINGEPHGPVAFENLDGTFFPAVSVNRNVQLTLRTGIIAPESDEECE